MKKSKISVGILGATGQVGGKLLALLENHPMFDLNFIAASPASVGKEIPFGKRMLTLSSHEDLVQAQSSCRLLFSALPSALAADWDVRYAKAGLGVISLSSAHRSAPDVPVIIPEINPHHLEVLALQKKRRGFEGFIVSKPNCSLQSFLIPLAPLHQQFGLKRLHVTTMQAISGAGLKRAKELDIEDNIIPFIDGEEGKTESEPLKILGALSHEGIVPTEAFTISSHCNRVPVSDGHLACVSASFQKRPSIDEILAAWKEFVPLPQQLKLPSAPHPLVHIFEEENRPQTRLDRLAGKGMAVSVGRLRLCPLLDIRFVALSHNTVRGAAGGALLIAELLQVNYT